MANSTLTWDSNRCNPRSRSDHETRVMRAENNGAYRMQNYAEVAVEFELHLVCPFRRLPRIKEGAELIQAGYSRSLVSKQASSFAAKHACCNAGAL